MPHILHVDMDEFFAAVEKLDNPELRGKPLLIGGDAKSRGVVSTASYEARPFGCHSAMPMAQAVRLCPQAIVLPVRGHRYAEVSEQVFAIFKRFTPVVEPLSIDEAFLDVAGCQRLFGTAEHIARLIKDVIRDEVGLTASVGVAPNKFLAKLASDLRKPDGLVVITEDTVRETLDPLPVRKIWGVGPAAEEQLARLGIKTIGQLRQYNPARLAAEVGAAAAEHYQRLARGEDSRQVVIDGEAKSISQEETFATDIADLHVLRRVLLEQTEAVARRLRRSGLKARTVSLKLRYGDFTTLSRSATLKEPTDNTDELWRQARTLLEAWAKSLHRPLRLLGVGVTQLAGQEGSQLSLFDDAARLRLSRLDAALDKITGKFGDDAVGRGQLK